MISSIISFSFGYIVYVLEGIGHPPPNGTINLSFSTYQYVGVSVILLKYSQKINPKFKSNKKSEKESPSNENPGKLGK